MQDCLSVISNSPLLHTKERAGLLVCIQFVHICIPYLFLTLCLIYFSLFLPSLPHFLFHIFVPPSMQTDQSNSSAQSHKLPPQKHSHLVEQVSNSSLIRQKGGGLTNPSLSSGLTSGLTSDIRLAEGRGAPVWTVEEREARISPLDLQVLYSLTLLTFW